MRSPLNKRLLLILATYFHPNSSSKFKMLFDVYQLSNITYFGHKPRSAVSLIISRASSTFDLPPFCHSRIETGILRCPSVQTKSTTCMPRRTPPAVLDQTLLTASASLVCRCQVGSSSRR